MISAVALAPTQKITGEDELLQDRVRSALYRAGYRPLVHINVDVEQGRIWLRGEVDSYYLKQVAQTAVMGVSGVSRVDNSLEVTIGKRFDQS